MNSFLPNPRLLTFLSLGLITPLGFLCKYYAGPGQQWFNDYAAGIWYEVFWCLVIFGLVPKPKAVTTIAVGVLAITCGLEILQLWQTPRLEIIRASWLGRILLGTTFSWWDFPHYILGCLIGWWWLVQISKRTTRQS